MMTKILALFLSMPIVFIYNSANAPTIISIDIEFCDRNKTFEKSICTIREAESRSNNRLLIDQNGKLKGIIIDKRSITLEKAKAIFEHGSVLIQQRSIINVPYLQKSILINPGEYKVWELRRGFKIEFV